MLGLGNFQTQLPLACSLSKTHICSLIAQDFESKQTPPRKKVLALVLAQVSLCVAVLRSPGGSDVRTSPGVNITRGNLGCSHKSWPLDGARGPGWGPGRRLLSPCRWNKHFCSSAFLPSPLFDFIPFLSTVVTWLAFHSAPLPKESSVSASGAGITRGPTVPRQPSATECKIRLWILRTILFKCRPDRGRVFIAGPGSAA